MSWLSSFDFLLRTCFTLDTPDVVEAPPVAENKKDNEKIKLLTVKSGAPPMSHFKPVYPSPTEKTESDFSVSSKTFSGWSDSTSYLDDPKKNHRHSNKSKLEILKRDNIMIEGILSSGRFGSHLLARCKGSDDSAEGKMITLNAFQKSVLMDTYQQHVPNREKQFLESFDHPFITTLLGTFSDRNCLYLITPLEVGGPLSHLLRNSLTYGITDGMKTFYAACILSVLKYAHDKNIIHRGLHPDSLLIDSTGYLKVTDWGFAKVVTDCTYTLCGHVEYLCPEAIVHDSGYGRGADYWALGVLIYEMHVGRSAFVPSSLDFKFDGKYEDSVSIRTGGNRAPSQFSNSQHGKVPEINSGIKTLPNNSQKMSTKDTKRSVCPSNQCDEEELIDFQDSQGYDAETIENILTREPIYPSYMPHPAKSVIQSLCQKVATQRLGTRRGGKGIEDIQTHVFFQDVQWTRLNKKLVTAPWVPTVAPSDARGRYYPNYSPKIKMTSVELNGTDFTGYNCPDWNSFK